MLNQKMEERKITHLIGTLIDGQDTKKIIRGIILIEQENIHLRDH
jgi:hypothetical protein